MSAYLKVNGIEVPCTGSEYEPVRMGEVSRALSGMPRSSVRVRKEELRFTTDELYLEEARALRRLLEGDGHVWSFETVQIVSSRALLPTVISEAGILTQYSAGRHGYGLTMPYESYVQWAAQVGSEWTALFWRNTPPGVWYHQVVRQRPDASPGAREVWENGVRNDGADVDLVTVDMSGNFRLTATEDATVFDEVVLLPYAVPDGWPELLYAFHNTQAWPELPYLWASGEAVEGAGLRCLGQAGTGRRVPKRKPDGTFTTGELFDITLHGA